MKKNRLNSFNEEVEQLRKTNGYAAVSKCLNEVYKDLDKNKEHFRVKNWYY